MPASDGPCVEIDSTGDVLRHRRKWIGMAAESIEAETGAFLQFAYSGDHHLLVVHERTERAAGTSSIGSGPVSDLRTCTQKLTFVPAGSCYRETLDLRAPARLLFFHFDLVRLGRRHGHRMDTTTLAPQLFFERPTLLDTALKLKALVDEQDRIQELYSEALATVLVHELVAHFRGLRLARQPARGGLAAWQERAVREYVDAHLDEQIPLSTLAGIARLSQYHFCRAFKRSFGLPPHRYHMQRRIDHAKALLKQRTHSVTDIGLMVGYSETSSFTAAFRKAAGTTPSAYQRRLA
ncbi:AraC family transcriptional regulator [Microbaculum marinum]|uniref:AraC family transcriptional regulator n=1 Tax=Microbaculum marinum TaxID=1764581 RepID=A0AAW9RQY0_9HYPH